VILQVEDSSGFDIGQTISIDWYNDDCDPVVYRVIDIKGNDVEVREA